jgi:ribosomal protein S1
VEKVDKAFLTGSKHKCRVTGFMGVEGIPMLSLKASMVDADVVKYADLEAGTIVEGSVLAIETWGTLLKLGDNVRGLVTPMHLADVAGPKGLKNNKGLNLKVGSKVRAAVLTVDSGASKANLTLKKSMLRVAEVSPALQAKAEAAKAAKAKGKKGGKKAAADEDEEAGSDDEKLDSDDEAEEAGGAKVGAGKKDGPVALRSYAQAKPGLVATGFVTKITAGGLIVTFFNNVYGTVSTAELEAAGVEVEDVAESYRVGQVLRVAVSRCGAAKGGKKRAVLELTLNTSAVDRATAESSDDDEEEEDGAGYAAGMVVGGTVLEAGESGLRIQMDAPEGAEEGGVGVLAFDHLVDHPQHAELAATLPLCVRGAKVKGLLVLQPPAGSAAGRRPAVLTKKPLLLGAAFAASAADSDAGEGRDILPAASMAGHTGAVLVGYVRHVSKAGVFVGFANGVSALAPRRMLSASYVSDPAALFAPGQSVRCIVAEAEAAADGKEAEGGGKFFVSLVPSAVEGASAAAAAGGGGGRASFLHTFLRERAMHPAAAEDDAGSGSDEDEDAPLKWRPHPVGSVEEATVVAVRPYGTILSLADGTTAFTVGAKPEAPADEEAAAAGGKKGKKAKKAAAAPAPKEGDTVLAVVLDVDYEKRVVDVSVDPAFVARVQAGRAAASAAVEAAGGAAAGAEKTPSKKKRRKGSVDAAAGPALEGAAGAAPGDSFSATVLLHKRHYAVVALAGWRVAYMRVGDYSCPYEGAADLDAIGGGTALSPARLAAGAELGVVVERAPAMAAALKGGASMFAQELSPFVALAKKELAALRKGAGGGGGKKGGGDGEGGATKKRRKGSMDGGADLGEQLQLPDLKAGMTVQCEVRVVKDQHLEVRLPLERKGQSEGSRVYTRIHVTEVDAAAGGGHPLAGFTRGQVCTAKLVGVEHSKVRANPHAGGKKAGGDADDDDVWRLHLSVRADELALADGKWTERARPCWSGTHADAEAGRTLLTPGQLLHGVVAEVSAAPAGLWVTFAEGVRGFCALLDAVTQAEAAEAEAEASSAQAAKGKKSKKAQDVLGGAGDAAPLEKQLLKLLRTKYAVGASITAAVLSAVQAAPASDEEASDEEAAAAAASNSHASVRLDVSLRAAGAAAKAAKVSVSSAKPAAKPMGAKQLKAVLAAAEAPLRVGQVVLGSVVGRSSRPGASAPSGKMCWALLSLGWRRFGRVCVTDLAEAADWADLPFAKEGSAEHDLGARFSDGAVHRCVVVKAQEKGAAGEQQIDLSFRAGLIEAGKTDAARAKAVAADADVSLPEQGALVKGYVASVGKKGCFVRVQRGLTAHVMLKDLSEKFLDDEQIRSMFPTGKLVAGRVLKVDPASKKVQLSLRKADVIGGIAEGGGKGGKGGEDDDEGGMKFDDLEEQMHVKGTITKVEAYGCFIRLKNSRLSGLCHISVASDEFVEDLASVFEPGDYVKAIVLKLDPEKKRISLGLKASFFTDADGDDDSDDDEEEESGEEEEEEESEEESDEEDADLDDEEEEEQGQKASKKAKVAEDSDDEEEEEDSDDEDEDEDEDSDEEDDSDDEAAPAAGGVGLDWGGAFGAFGAKKTAAAGEDDSSDEDEDEDDEDDESAAKGKGSSSSKKKQAERRLAEEKVRLRELALMHGTALPESAEDFERLLVASPNSSFVWTKYMTFMLSLTEIERARAVGERALAKIAFRDEQEKLNMWLALMQLEHKYGSESSLAAVVKRAVQANEPKRVRFLLLGVYNRAGERENEKALLQLMCKKHAECRKVWGAAEDFEFAGKKGEGHEDARKIMQRSLQSLPKHKHVRAIVGFAGMEFSLADRLQADGERQKHGGDAKGRAAAAAERASSTMESVLENYPKRTDLWTVYLDKEIKRGVSCGDLGKARQLFERVISMRFGTKTMKLYFKKYLGFEEAHGSPKEVDAVKNKAREYVKSVT